MERDRALLWCGFLCTVAGVGTALTMLVLMGTSDIDDWGFLLLIFRGGLLLAVGGLIILIIAAALRLDVYPRTERGRAPARSLRQWALIVIGIGAGIVLALVLLQVVVDSIGIHYAPMDAILPTIIFTGGCALAVGGLVTLLLDGVLRLTGRRF